MKHYVPFILAFFLTTSFIYADKQSEVESDWINALSSILVKDANKYMSKAYIKSLGNIDELKVLLPKTHAFLGKTPPFTRNFIARLKKRMDTDLTALRKYITNPNDMDGKEFWTLMGTTFDAGEKMHSVAKCVKAATSDTKPEEWAKEELKVCANVGQSIAKADPLALIDAIFEEMDEFKIEYDSQFEEAIQFVIAAYKAGNQDEKEKLIRNVIVTTEFWNVKRRAGWGLQLNAYLGVGVGFDNNPDENKSIVTLNGQSESTFFSVFAPIGLELSHSWKWVTVSVMGNLIDLANPVMAIVNNSTDNYQFKDIFSPGGSLLFTLRGMPLTIGLSYVSVSLQVKDDVALSADPITNQREGVFYAYMAYDRPLVSLF